MRDDLAKGIDVSHHNGVVDWPAVRASGVSFVGLKATEGNTVTDDRFKENQAGVRAAGFELAIYYHFARSGSPRIQAKRLLETVGQFDPVRERLCLDLEVSPEERYPMAWVRDFFQWLWDDRSSMKTPFIYTSKRIWRMLGDQPHYYGRDIALWAPRYNSAGNEPALPSAWQTQGWTIWQWTDGGDTGPEHLTLGVQGPCDANYFCGNVQELIRWRDST